MRRSALLTLLFLALATAPGLALELSAPSYALPPQVSVVDADAGHLRLAVDVPALAVEDVTLDGTTFQALSLPGGELGGEAGRAALPVFSQLIAVPAGMVARIRSTDAQERVLDGTRPAPLQPDDADRLAYDRAWYANGVAAAQPQLVEARGVAIGVGIEFPPADAAAFANDGRAVGVLVGSLLHPQGEAVARGEWSRLDLPGQLQHLRHFRQRRGNFGHSHVNLLQ